MSYHINAWLEDGVPQLEVIDAESKHVCLSWSYKEYRPSEPRHRYEVQRLFRKLLLLTCKQELKDCRVFEVRDKRGYLN